ncbi:MAG: hypothetical protein AAF624_08595 [Bacteroidota bacterium]
MDVVAATWASVYLGDVAQWHFNTPSAHTRDEAAAELTTEARDHPLVFSENRIDREREEEQVVLLWAQQVPEVRSFLTVEALAAYWTRLLSAGS